MNQSFEQAKNNLEKSVLYHMSLSSKELFHSNFWEWLINYDNDYVKVFFSKYDNEKVLNVYREKNNLDLVVETKKGFYLLENKIKSIPDEQQLDRYTEKMKNENIIQKVVCFITNDYHILSSGWEYLSYKEISNRINEISTSKNNQSYEQATIKEYCFIVDNICICLNELIMETQNKLYYDNQLLKGIRLHDVFNKIKYSEFYHKIMEEIVNIEMPAGFTFDCYQGILHSVPLVSIRLKKDNILIGVEIQGYNYSRCGQIFGASLEDTFNYFANIGWLDKDYERKRNGKRPYLKYETKEYSFVYQPYSLEGTKIDYLTLITNIKADLISAKNRILLYK